MIERTCRYSVFCDHLDCMAWEAEAETKIEAARAARQEGWVLWRGIWYCPEHKGEPARLEASVTR